MTYKELLTRLDKYPWWQLRRVTRGGTRMYLVTIGFSNKVARDEHAADLAKKVKKAKKKKFRKAGRYEYVPPPPLYRYFVGLSVSLAKAIRFARKKKHPHTFDMETIKLPDYTAKKKKRRDDDDE